MKAKTKLSFADMPKDYAGLCGVLLPRPIRDSVDYANVAEVTDAMVLWRKDFTADQRDYFDMLCALIEDYDAEHVKWPKVKGREILRHLLDEHDLAAADLSRILGGSRNLGAMILRGDRNLTLEHIRKLAAHFKAGPELFI
ncbi:MAG: helix-turn-helix domain-containing protein [Limisphaerales bacterium]